MVTNNSRDIKEERVCERDEDIKIREMEERQILKEALKVKRGGQWRERQIQKEEKLNGEEGVSSEKKEREANKQSKEEKKDEKKVLLSCRANITHRKHEVRLGIFQGRTFLPVDWWRPQPSTSLIKQHVL